MVLFPLFDRHETWPWASKNRESSAISWESFRHLYYDWEWKKRVGSYHLKLANSQFTREWTKRRWDVDSEVVYPPLGICFTKRQKANMILSVGRFATGGHSKKQVEMVSGFRSWLGQGVQDWEYSCVGGLGGSPKDRAYFEKVRCLGEGYPVQVIDNVERKDLRKLYERAKIFWHAAGYNNDSEIYPKLEEHIGSSKVEAMAAGCVPVVINRGGSPD